ncbi:MAG TPA: N-6 DNA methylase [Terracidiphilus sp.]|jgi:hypothetical protein
MNEARSGAVRYEDTLEPGRRKALGQFFTGLPLSRLLAAVAISDTVSTVIDPMAGHGDLLDAVAERAALNKNHMNRIQAIEIDPATAEMCRRRLGVWDRQADELLIDEGDAFDPRAAHTYLAKGYDLVITNPPYVRYQTLAAQNGDIPQLSPEMIRRHLGEIVRGRVASQEFRIWRTLVEKYSGLADLSVPAWILSAALVRPGGVLALVAPATWRSRNYGDVIEYLLARCFRLEYLIEDTQPGWFSDALVRTQLVIARRLTTAETGVPLSERRANDGAVVTVKVSPEASGNGSLVGSSFPDGNHENAFAAWLRSANSGSRSEVVGLDLQLTPVSEIVEETIASGHRRSWFRNLEPGVATGPLFEEGQQSPLSLVPPRIRPLFESLTPVNLALPDVLGLSISQGLRTGCNGFFYVDRINEKGKTVRIRLSALFDNQELDVPASCLMPVVRRQSEVTGPIAATQLRGRVLDLSAWILPEDAEDIDRARPLYEREGIPVPKVMPVELANFIRSAGEMVYSGGHEPKRICELSAVRTNARSPGGDRPPRFWYMLPAFAMRHHPAAFVPRINQGIPWIEMNDDPPVLIDANFSTIWGESSKWTRFALRAFLNTTWCRACMEALGTPLGGGALKLEAAQLKRLPIPVVNTEDLAMLDAEGRAMSPDATSVGKTVDRFILAKITGVRQSDLQVTNLLKGLQSMSEALCQGRQRNGA